MESQTFKPPDTGTGIPVFLFRTLRFAALGQELWFYVLALSRAVVVFLTRLGLLFRLLGQQDGLDVW